MPDVLQHAFLRIKPYSMCVTNETLEALDRSSLNLTVENQFCATSEKTASSCPGDSGGPFQCFFDGKRIRNTEIGFL